MSNRKFVVEQLLRAMRAQQLEGKAEVQTFQTGTQAVPAGTVPLEWLTTTFTYKLPGMTQPITYTVKIPVPRLSFELPLKPTITWNATSKTLSASAPSGTVPDTFIVPETLVTDPAAKATLENKVNTVTYLDPETQKQVRVTEGGVPLGVPNFIEVGVSKSQPTGRGGIIGEQYTAYAVPLDSGLMLEIFYGGALKDKLTDYMRSIKTALISQLEAAGVKKDRAENWVGNFLGKEDLWINIGRAVMAYNLAQEWKSRGTFSYVKAVPSADQIPGAVKQAAESVLSEIYGRIGRAAATTVKQVLDAFNQAVVQFVAALGGKTVGGEVWVDSTPIQATLAQDQRSASASATPRGDFADIEFRSIPIPAGAQMTEKTAVPALRLDFNPVFWELAGRGLERYLDTVVIPWNDYIRTLQATLQAAGVRDPETKVPTWDPTQLKEGEPHISFVQWFETVAANLNKFKDQLQASGRLNDFLSQLNKLTSLARDYLFPRGVLAGISETAQAIAAGPLPAPFEPLRVVISGIADYLSKQRGWLPELPGLPEAGSVSAEPVEEETTGGGGSVFTPI